MKKSQLRKIIREVITEQQQQTINGGNCDGKIILPGSNYDSIDLAKEIIDIYGPTADFRNYAGKSNLVGSVCNDFPPGTVCCVTDNFGNPDPQDKIWIHSPTWKNYTTNVTYHTFQDIVNFLNSMGHMWTINDPFEIMIQHSTPPVNQNMNLNGVFGFSSIGYCNDCDQEIGCTDPTAINFCSTCTQDNGSCEYRRKPTFPLYSKK